MKHICHISTMHPTFDTRIFRNECLSLVAYGYQVTLVVPHDRKEVVDGVHIVPLKRHQSFYDRLVTCPKSAVAQLQTIDADLFHFHDPELLSAMGKFARETDRMVVWDAHENYVHTIKSFNSLKFKPLSYLGSWYF